MSDNEVIGWGIILSVLLLGLAAAGIFAVSAVNHNTDTEERVAAAGEDIADALDRATPRLREYNSDDLIVCFGPSLRGRGPCFWSKQMWEEKDKSTIQISDHARAARVDVLSFLGAEEAKP